MASFRCTVTNPEKKVFEGDVHSLVLPAVDGELGILARHAPMIGALGCGELRIDAGGQGKQTFFVDDGFVHVHGHEVSILAARALPASALDLDAEEAALRRLEDAKPEGGAEAREARAREIRVARARVKVARKARG